MKSSAGVGSESAVQSSARAINCNMVQSSASESHVQVQVMCKSDAVQCSREQVQCSQVLVQNSQIQVLSSASGGTN